MADLKSYCDGVSDDDRELVPILRPLLATLDLEDSWDAAELLHTALHDAYNKGVDATNRRLNDAAEAKPEPSPRQQGGVCLCGPSLDASCPAHGTWQGSVVSSVPEAPEPARADLSARLHRLADSWLNGAAVRRNESEARHETYAAEVREELANELLAELEAKPEPAKANGLHATLQANIKAAAAAVLMACGVPDQCEPDAEQLRVAALRCRDLGDALRKAVEAAKSEPAKASGWVLCSKGLPEPGKLVQFAISDESTRCVGYYYPTVNDFEATWLLGEDEVDLANVYAWRELPAPPDSEASK